MRTGRWLPRILQSASNSQHVPATTRISRPFYIEGVPLDLESGKAGEGPQ
jgi:hypothetical protein